MPAPREAAHDRVAQLAVRQAQIDVLTARLAQAERAVAHARTHAAATAAHHRADALLLELEAAEHDLCTQEEAMPPARAETPARKRRTPTGQGHLFDVG